jgi:hypothetical protein
MRGAAVAIAIGPHDKLAIALGSVVPNVIDIRIIIKIVDPPEGG